MSWEYDEEEFWMEYGNGEDNKRDSGYDKDDYGHEIINVNRFIKVYSDILFDILYPETIKKLKLIRLEALEPIKRMHAIDFIQYNIKCEKLSNIKSYIEAITNPEIRSCAEQILFEYLIIKEIPVYKEFLDYEKKVKNDKIRFRTECFDLDENWQKYPEQLYSKLKLFSSTFHLADSLLIDMYSHYYEIDSESYNKINIEIDHHYHPQIDIKQNFISNLLKIVQVYEQIGLTKMVKDGEHLHIKFKDGSSLRFNINEDLSDFDMKIILFLPRRDQPDYEIFISLIKSDLGFLNFPTNNKLSDYKERIRQSWRHIEVIAGRA